MEEPVASSAQIIQTKTPKEEQSIKTPRGSAPLINLYDTDVGELYQVPVNERW